jgi:hypothetical protein
MAREQERKQTSSDSAVSRRTYLRLSGAAAVGATVTTVSESNTPNVLSIVGTTTEPTTYEVTVTGEIVPGPGTDALSVLGTTGQSAEDAIGNGIRRYHFDGEITDLRIGDGATAFVNGAAVGSTTSK